MKPTRSVGRPKTGRKGLHANIAPETVHVLEVLAAELVVSRGWIVERAVERYLNDVEAGGDIAVMLSSEALEVVRNRREVADE